MCGCRWRCVFFLKDTATTESYTYGHTLSLHDALPIFFEILGGRILLNEQAIERLDVTRVVFPVMCQQGRFGQKGRRSEEHTSELQSLMRISYAVFCLKKQI